MKYSGMNLKRTEKLSQICIPQNIDSISRISVYNLRPEEQEGGLDGDEDDQAMNNQRGHSRANVDSGGSGPLTKALSSEYVTL